MNRLVIIGNLTGNPELRTTQAGKSVCSFNVAVNRRKKSEGQPDADFFRVSTWNQLAENCGKYLTKGKKVCVVGAVSVRSYETQDGRHGANLEVMANEVEFLSTKESDQPKMTEVTVENNPFDEMPY